MEPFYRRRPHYVAMRDERRHAQDRRDRGRAGQGEAAHRGISSSPPRRTRDPDRTLADRPHDRPHKRQPIERSPEPSRDRFRDRSRDRSRRFTPSPPRHDTPRDDRHGSSRPRNLIDTRRDRGGGGGETRRTRSPSPRPSRHGALSSSASKRPISRTPPPSKFERKRPRRDDSPPRNHSRDSRLSTRDRGALLDSRDSRRSASASRRPYSPRRHSSRSRPKDRDRRHGDQRRSRSRSPAPRPRRDARLDSPPGRHRDRDNSRTSRRRSRSRSPPRRSARQSLSPRKGHIDRSPHGSRVPRGERGSRHASRSTSRDSGWRARQGANANSKAGEEQPSTGVNSLEVGMTGRSHRGSFGGRHQVHGAGDPRQYSQSPHVTPNPYHNSPHGSPYGRGGWNGSPSQYVPNGFPLLLYHS